MKKSLAVIVALIFFLPSAEAAKKVTTKKNIPKEDSSKTQVLWQQWYLFSQNDQILGRYFEEVERRGSEKQLAVSQKWKEWQEVGGATTELYIGSVAKDDVNLSPVAFYVERKEPGKQENIEARFKNGKMILKTINNNKVIKKEIPFPSKTILSATFPLLIAKQGMNGNKKPFNYKAVVEDGTDGKFNLVNGEAIIQSVSEKINGDDCYKINLVIDGILSHWWIRQDGKLCQAITPQIGNKIIQTTENSAKSAIP